MLLSLTNCSDLSQRPLLFVQNGVLGTKNEDTQQMTLVQKPHFPERMMSNRSYLPIQPKLLLNTILDPRLGRQRS